MNRTSLNKEESRGRGTVALIGSVQALGTDSNRNSVSISITADNVNKSLSVKVMGLVSKNIHWLGTWRRCS